MAKKKGGSRRTPNRTATRRAPSDGSRVRMANPAELELMKGVREALHHPDPTAILVTGAMIAANVLDMASDELPEDWVGLVQSFMEIDIAETTALLHFIAVTTEDDLLRTRIRRALAERRQPMPAHITGLGRVEVTESWLMDDELGDGDNVVLGATWPGGEQVTATIYIDHNMGTIVKDAFIVNQPVDEVIDRYREIIRSHEPDSRMPRQIDLADARARIDDAIRNFDERAPTWSQDQWPACRAFIELLVRRLPTGGQGYARHSSSRSMINSLTEEFLLSPQAERLAGVAAASEAAAALFQFADEHSGDPLRWSPIVVEIALHELGFDERISEAALDAIPAVLRPVVLFAHDNLPVGPASTRQTLDAVTRWLPTLDIARQTGITARLRESTAMLAAAEAGDLGPFMRHLLMEQVGSEYDIEDLDDDPLPEEDLDLDEVPPDLEDRVRTISGHIDRFSAAATESFGAEFRTACRRFLSTVAELEPEVLRRRAKDENTAAAIAWLVARANGLIGYHHPQMLAKDLAAHFGLSSPPSSRAETLRVAFVGEEIRGSHALADPDLLVSSHRRHLIEMRERYWNSH